MLVVVVVDDVVVVVVVVDVEGRVCYLCCQK